MVDRLRVSVVNSPWFWALVAGILALGAALSALQWGVNGSQSPFATDVGEIQNALPRWGTIHFTGYPLYTFLGSCWVTFWRMVGVEPAAGSSLWSALWGAAAAALFALVAMELGASGPLAALGALIATLSTSAWIDNSLAEIHSLTMAFTGATLWLALRYERTGARRDLAWLTILFTQGVAHQRAVAFMGLGLLTLVAHRWRAIVRDLPLLIGLALLAPLTYLYLPIRAWMGADWTFGEPGTWRGFWTMILDTKAERILASPASWGEWVERAKVVAQLLRWDLPYALLIPGALGLLIPALRRRWRESLGLILAGAPYLALCLVIWEGRISDALLAVKLPPVYLAGVGLALWGSCLAPPSTLTPSPSPKGRGGPEPSGRGQGEGAPPRMCAGVGGPRRRVGGGRGQPDGGASLHAIRGDDPVETLDRARATTDASRRPRPIQRLYALYHAVLIVALAATCGGLFYAHRPDVLAITRDPAAEAVIATVAYLTPPAPSPRTRGEGGAGSPTPPLHVPVERGQGGEVSPGGVAFMALWGHDYWALTYAQAYRGQLQGLRLVDHNADFPALLASGQRLMTLDRTFYERPLAWWDERLSAQVRLSMPAPGIVEIAAAPPTAAPQADQSPFDLGMGVEILEAQVSEMSPVGEEARLESRGYRLTVIWRAQRDLAEDWAVAVHLLAANPPAGPQDILAQADRAHPVAGWYPISRWQAGEVVRDEYIIPPAAGGAPQPVAIRIGLYRPDPAGGYINSEWLVIEAQ